MKYKFIADTDVGISRSTNQDSVLVKHATYNKKEVLLAIVCDGMGGLSKGELASATVIRAFSKWFDESLPYELEDLDLNVVGGKWSVMLKNLNSNILEYSKNNKSSMGTTFSGVLFAEDKYLIVHVGDTRVYQIGAKMNQLTTDQTFVAREIGRGTMTVEQAKNDKRRNLLLQCIGASTTVDPQVLIGDVEKGAYLICSDGFRHEISDAEMFESLNPVNLVNEKSMHSNTRYLIDLVKQRKEKDNISAVLIKTI